MNVHQRKEKRVLSVLMSVLLVLQMLSFSAFAWTSEAGTQCVAASGERYVGFDGKYYYGKANVTALYYNTDGSTYTQSYSTGKPKHKYLLLDSTGSHHVYCAEAGTLFSDGDSYTSKNGANSRYFQNLPLSAQSGIMLALMYGWHEGMSSPIAETNQDDYAFATQTIIWEFQQQLRTSPAVIASGHGIDADMYSDALKGRPAEKCYRWILDQMAKHYTPPSFAANSQAKAELHTLRYDPNTGNYTLTLTDTNNILADLNLSASGIAVTRSGNEYTFTSQEMLTEPVMVTIQKNMHLDTGKMLIWGCGGRQTMVSGASDPVHFYFQLNTETNGVGHMVKTSEDGKVAGVRFTVTGNGVNQTVITGADGTVDLDLMPGTYTVTEQTDDIYTPQASQTVTIVSGQTSTVNFHNTLKRGKLKVTKTAEDCLNEGATFHLYGISESGLSVDEYAVTDHTGVATFHDVPIGKDYTLEEVNTEERYVIPEQQTVVISWNEVTNKSFHNTLKKWNLTVTKVDMETTEAQGNATLSGAQYGVFQGGILVDTYDTDTNGQFTTKYYPCGNDWFLREIDSSEGYLLTIADEPIGADAMQYTAEYNSLSLTVTEQIKRGKISLIKHSDNGDTKIETPEEGAAFEVYLKSAGSYDAAKETERDFLVCDEFGFAETKELPYGIYVVRQVNGWEGSELMKPFEVFISENGLTYRYLLNNAPLSSYVKVVKLDSTTGNVIPSVGAGFEIYDPFGNKVEMTYTYPTVTTIDTFYTDAEGMLITPETLPYGEGYSLVEVQAPYGYVLDQTPVYFDITEDCTEEESGVTVVTVEKKNAPQMGIITVEKLGECFKTVQKIDGMYQPVYEVGGLAGAEYTITTAEDIYTPDGTLRYAKGDVVSTLETQADGKAKTPPLFLGTYHVTETKAPYGMVLANTVQTVELNYAGQEIELTETSICCYNDRQKAELTLKKVMEKSEIFSIGEHGEITAVAFGLYAAEDLIADDESMIPADGLLEIAYCNEEGTINFCADLPVGAKTYVKEITTDSHYVLSEEAYPVAFEYAGQDTATVHLSVNDEILNELIYGTVTGYKKNRETGEPIQGALFGLFRADETNFSEDNALLTAESNEDGIFTFENVVYGSFVIKELQPAEGYLPNETVYHVTIEKDEQVIEITVENDLIPEIGTTASIHGKKEVEATQVFTLTDVVSYKHLIPGKAYTVKGILMDKKTGEAFLENGKQITAEVSFVPEQPSGSIEVIFSFDARRIQTDIDIVVFEHLYADGKELAVHADLADKDQTVTVRVPKPDVPKTGDDTKVGLWALLCGSSFAGLAACTVVYFKKKKNYGEE